MYKSKNAQKFMLKHYLMDFLRIFSLWHMALTSLDIAPSDFIWAMKILSKGFPAIRITDSDLQIRRLAQEDNFEMSFTSKSVSPPK